ncbi:hypothetical protein OS187_01195 [Xanthomonadaceae bacterium JHOS43]|nr:hypothetical protein [Xanthomonadaceae bacterium JHOS43]
MYPTHPLLRWLAIILLAMMPAVTAMAATHTWPGTAPCAGVLQACVNHAGDGDQILIATNTPITTGAAVVDKRLALRAADGFNPVFQNAGLSAYNNSGFNADIGLSVSNIRFEGGQISATYSGTGTATVDLRQLDIIAPAGTSGISVSAQSGLIHATLHDNRVSGGPTSIWSGLIDLRARHGGELEAELVHNRVTRKSTVAAEGAGIFVHYFGNGTDGQVKMHGNTVRGSFGTGGIFIGEGDYTYTAPITINARLYNNVVIGSGSALDTGIRLGVTNGQIHTHLINNTVTRVGQAFTGGRWSVGASTGTLDGLVHNNILVAGWSINLSDGVGASLANGNNLINGATFGMTMDASTLVAPARLLSHVDARLASDSPAIDAGDNDTLGLGLILSGLPSTDADGLRRFKKKTPTTAGTNRVDIGAYEYGDVSFSHIASATNTSGHTTSLTHPAINDQAGANLFATPRYLPGATPEHGHPIGTWEFSGTWNLYNKDTTLAMPLGARYNVFAAAAGSGVSRHVTSAGNVSGATSQLVLTDNPDFIVLAMQHYNSGAVANPHQTGVFHFSMGGGGAWFVTNLDTTRTMPIGVGFSLYAQRPSPNVFRVTASAGNLSGGDTLVLDHPLLNGNSCAQPVITRVFTHSDGSNFDMEYSTSRSRWIVYDYNGMPLGSRFHVLVNPAQAETCGGPLFSDGFE